MSRIDDIIKLVFFPKFCLLCGRWGMYLCDICAKKLDLRDSQLCPECSRKHHFGLTHQLCKKKYSLDGHISLFLYSRAMRKLIMTFKFRLASEVILDTFSQIQKQNLDYITADYLELCKPDLIIPVPLHKNRQRERGFNQADLISQLFTKTFPTQICNDIVARIKDTPHQSKTRNKKERQEHISGAFAVRKPEDIQNKTILIIDDVWTTGSTIKEITKVLKQAGSGSVYAWTLAHG